MRRAAWIATGSLLLAAGCKGNPVTVTRLDAATAQRQRSHSVLTGDAPSGWTTTALDDHGLEELPGVDDPERVLAAIAAGDVPEPARSLASAELLLALARRLEEPQASACALEVALTCWRAMAAEWPGDARFDGRFGLLRDLYAEAVGDFVVAHHAHRRGDRLVRAVGRSYRLVVQGSCDLDGLDELLVAGRIGVTGISHRFRHEGIGAALVGVRSDSRRAAPRLRHMPPEGTMLPLNAVLVPTADGAVALSITDAYSPQQVMLRDRTVQLATDVTAAYACLLARTELDVARNRGFFTTEGEGVRQGLHFLQPYDPQRQTVIMVHGLWSSPLIWRELTNELWGDAELRSRIQIWHYVYPTGVPILSSARVFRATLCQTIAELDPEGDDPALRDIVVIGHSMGGVIAKVLLQSSGHRVWDARFTRPLAELDLDDAERRLARETYFFEPHPAVSRAVFLAVPHRGSAEADGAMAQLAKSLIGSPRRIRTFFQRLVDRNPGVMRAGPPAAPTSVDVLSPTHAVLCVLAELPIAPGVTYHSVIGSVDGGDGEGATDSVVTYASAHLDGAASELVVRSDHSVPMRPAAWREVARILAEHLAGRGR